MANRVIEDAPDPIILVLKGPPGAGKTSWAKNYVKGKKDWLRVNRDELRRMSGDYWMPHREQVITIAEITMIEEGLRRGFNIIIDDTNLNPKTMEKWNEIASKFSCKLKVKEFIVPYKEALERDKNREFPVGDDTIRIFYKRYYPELLTAEEMRGND